MSAHTPGPWQVNHRNPFQVCDADGEVRGCAPIATVAAIGSLRECRANVRVIAAAPKMLAALQECAAALEQYDTLPSDKAKALRKALRAVIVEAEGA